MTAETGREGRPDLQRAWAWYERSIRSKVEPEHHGEYVMIDLDTGEYMVGKDKGSMARAMHARKPGVSLMALRVGYEESGLLGGNGHETKRRGRVMTMETATRVERRTADEAVRLAWEWYERDIRFHVEPDHHGEYVMIDVDTGDYMVGKETGPMARALHSQKPGVDLVALRIGYEETGLMGGSYHRSSDDSRSSDAHASSDNPIADRWFRGGGKRNPNRFGYRLY